jgi:hypothetical protein
MFSTPMHPHSIFNMSTPAANLETLQRAVGYRFGNHQLLKTALSGDEWLAEVGRAAVISVLSEFGADKVRQCLSEQCLSRIAAKLEVECDVFCILGAIRLDISSKRPISKLEEVFTRLFNLPSKVTHAINHAVIRSLQKLCSKLTLYCNKFTFLSNERFRS